MSQFKKDMVQIAWIVVFKYTVILALAIGLTLLGSAIWKTL